MSNSEPTAPGNNIILSEEETVDLVTLMSMPGYKVLKKISQQRKDHIARASLNSSNFEAAEGVNDRYTFYYKGMAAENVTFFQTNDAIKKAAAKAEKKSDK
jgi:hypothetical protein